MKTIFTIFSAIFITVSAQAHSDATQLATCYTSAYKKIIVEIMGISKISTGLKNQSDEAFEKALNKAALYAAQTNGLFDVNFDEGEPQITTIYKANSPEDLLNVSKGEIFTIAGLDRSMGRALFISLGNNNAGFYAPQINHSLNNNFSDKIKSIPECKGAF